MNITPVQIHNTNTSLDILFSEYISECTFSKQLSKETIKGYERVYATFRKIMPEISQTFHLYPQVFNEFFKRISTRKRLVGKNTIKIGVKTSTIKTYYNKLIAFFRWLEEYNYIEKRSLVCKIKKPPNPIYDDEKSLSDSEVAKIISAITLGSMNNPLIFKRDIVIASLLLYTGIRKGELLGLRVFDIDFEQRMLFVNSATSKSKKSRKIPIHSVLLNHLRSYLIERKNRKLQSEYLIISTKSDTRLSRDGLKYWVEKYKKKSGVSFHLHRFRHTFACKLAKKQADIISIRNALGHTTTRMTERYLRSIKMEDSRTFIDQMSF